ncbi:MAG: ATP-binding protein [Clostridiales bacterium]
MWIYGAPFSGKTTLANAFPNPLMLNTDGNIKFVDAPYIPIKNEVSIEGRRTVTTLAWNVFRDAISELEKKDNDFKTIIVDLLEDCYEHCRLYCYDKLSIEHESDNSFKAWDYVRTEFLSTLKRLMNLDYENIILISHEDTSKDITKKSGDKITAIKPNLQEKTANKVSGMVDIVARVVADGDERTLNFKSNEVIFGGGRLHGIISTSIPLDYEALMSVYDEIDMKPAKTETKKTEKKSRKPKETPKENELIQEQEEPVIEVSEPQEAEAEVESTPESQESAEPEVQDIPKEETRTRRTRKVRGE